MPRGKYGPEGPPHGTVSRYTSAIHKCRCVECKAVMSEYNRRQAKWNQKIKKELGSNEQ